jgi:hypothetical protein
MKITPVSRNLEDVFRGNFLRIPRFQRPYDWDRDNLVEFWNDLKDRADAEYFMGSIVVYADKKDRNIISLVDGQQRITTITIMLCLIRNSFEELGEIGSANAIHALIERPDLDDKNTFVLEHDPPDKYLQYQIQSRNPTEKNTPTGLQQENMRDAFRYLERALRDFLDKDGSEKISAIKALKHLRDCVLQMQFIAIELDSEDDACLIFETLNTRGKDLRVTDLLKNYFMRLLPNKNKGMDTTKSIWDEVMVRLSSVTVNIDPDSFLLHYWLSKEGFVSKASLFTNLKTVINKNTAKAKLEDIRDASVSYVRAIAPLEAEWAKEENSLRDSLQALRIFGVAQAAPLILAIMRAREAKIISLRSSRGAIELIEKFTFQFNALTQSRGGGGVSNMYSKLAQSVSACATAQNFSDVCSEIKEKFQDRVPDLTQFSLPFVRLVSRSSYTRDRALVRYVLIKLAKHFGMPDEVDPNLLTIEHILPQSQGDETFDEFDVGAMGNLILVGEKLNGQLGNKKFSEKKPSFTRENLVYIDPFIEKCVEWDRDCIAVRGHSLAPIGYYKIWNI